MIGRTEERKAAVGLLGDTPTRDYSRKLHLFNAFAEPELRRAIVGLGLRPGMRVLDAGCGTGEALHWLWDAVKPDGRVLGVELATAHVREARRGLAKPIEVIQGDLLDAALPAESFDLIWCVNTLHHLRDPLLGLKRLASLLRAGGRMVVGQSSLVPDMYFAWDSRLEQAANDAVRSYYRERYSLDEREFTAVRSLLGRMRRAPLHNASVRTVMIERVTPLRPADEAYLLEAIFEKTWGDRLRPWLSADDRATLSRLCDPQHPQFALRRDDFHFLQTLTLAVGEI